MKTSFYYSLCLENKFGDEKEHEILIKVTGYWPGSPGSMYRSNGDPGDPPEAEEIEYEIWVLHGKRKRPLPTWCKFQDDDDIIERLDRAAIDEVEDDAADSYASAMERRADEWRERIK